MGTSKRIVIVALVAVLSIVAFGCKAPVKAGGGPQTTAPVVAPLVTSAGNVAAEQLRTVSVNGTGTASARPDVAYLQFGVEAINVDAAVAINKNTESMSAVMAAITELKVEDKDVQTVNYSMWIEQQQDDKGKPVGEPRYHVVNTVRVRLRDLAKTGTLLQKVLKAGANSVGGISFSVAEPGALEREARDKAIADAKAKAEQLITGLGKKLGGVRMVSESEIGRAHV
jgi:uncharacterized protein